MSPELINLSQEIVNAQNIGFSQAAMFNSQVIYGIYFAFVLLIISLIVWYYFWQDSKKSRFLRFHTKDEASIIKGNIDDQKFISKNRAWHIKDAKPIFLKTFFGKRPLYLVRDDVCLPFIWSEPETKKKDEPDKIIMSAESLKKFCDHDNIKTLMKMSQSGKSDMFLWLGMGAALGIVLGLILRGFF